MDKDICRNAPCKISGASDHIYAQVLLSEYLSPLFSLAVFYIESPLLVVLRAEYENIDIPAHFYL